MAMRRATIGTTAEPLALFNPRRTALVVKNTTATQLIVSNDSANIATAGFPLENGETITFNVGLGDEPQLALYGIVSAGSTTVAIVEQFRQVENAIR